MLNGLKFSEVRDSDLVGPSTTAKARLFLLVTVLVGVASIVGAAFIMSDRFLKEGSDGSD
jgi:hypothetical protein